MFKITKIEKIRLVVSSYIELRATRLKNILLSLLKLNLGLVVLVYSFK